MSVLETILAWIATAAFLLSVLAPTAARGPQGPWRRLLLLYGTVLVPIVVAVGAILLVRTGIRDLTAPPYPVEPVGRTELGSTGTTHAIGQLLLLAVSSGALACAVTEFIRRQSPLRSWFNRTAAARFFGDSISYADPSAAGPSAASSATDASGPAGPSDPRAGSPDTVPRGPAGPSDPRAGSPDTVPRGLETRLKPPVVSYDVSLRQLTAQLSPILAHAARIVADETLPQTERHLALEFVVGKSAADELPTTRTTAAATAGPEDAGDAGDAEDVTQLLVMHAERRLDSFQIDQTHRWHQLLRRISAILASALLVAVAVASGSSVSGTLVAAGLGLVVGGPIAWVVRDIVRVVERKAAVG